MIIFFAALSAGAAAVSLVFDVIVICWHLEERRRFAEDEQRISDDEELWGQPAPFGGGAQIERADDPVSRPFGFDITARKRQVSGR